MRCQVPQISWHSRDPVLSIDFQPNQTDVLRLASGGTDSHVLIWYITYQENKSIKIECASDLYRHNKSVNVVRFSPSGQLLASGDDEGAMFIWELKEREQTIEISNEDENINKEDWYPVKLLRGHLEDIYDICWSKDGNFLVSSSMDNTAIIWDMQKYMKVHMFSDFKGYVQGVSWDPCNQFIASVGSDRSLRIHNINSKKVMYKISKAPWTNSTGKGTFKARLFYDDTLQSYFRRLTFTPDGELLIVPSGILEKGEKINNTCYIFSRHALNKPVISLPTGDKYTVAVKCNPLLYKLRREHDTSDKIAKPMIKLPYRMIFAVAACDSVLLYDTEQLVPFAYVSNIHYTHLTDLSWSSDGFTLVVSSTDGYCSFILFTKEELGEIYVAETPEDTKKEFDEAMDVSKNEKSDLNQTSSLIASNSEAKDISTPNTPKAAIRISAKSPRLNSNNNDESVTPSSKAKLVTNKKCSKKSPKICSIKKFLVSPKTVSPSVHDEENKPAKQCSANNEAVVSIKPEVIELSDSPMKAKEMCSESSINMSKNNRDCENVNLEAHIKQQEEAMDVDENHSENICSDNLQTSPNSTSTGKQSKCKIRLDFADKNEIMAVIDDNASDSNPTTFTQDNIESLNEPNVSNENDWKLELSQDDDILPMEVTTLVPEDKSVSSKAFNLNSSSKESAVSVQEQKPVSCKEAPKRRVPFVTLSSKTTFQK